MYNKQHSIKLPFFVPGFLQMYIELFKDNFEWLLILNR